MGGINHASVAPIRAIRDEMRLIVGVIGYEAYPAAATVQQRKIWEECDSLFFVNARSALKWLFEQLKPRTAWFPSYLCPAILKAVPGTAPEIRIFPVGKNLLC